ncbi:MAG: hypothetical protein HOW73_08635 [Polyangiaceae bacterium]|nr:hypothetical protein [Polyangiaceae bacterium]
MSVPGSNRGNTPSDRGLPPLSDDDDEPTSQRQCIDCKTVAPATHTAHTLISARFGWRLSRRITPTGLELSWRCPTCWKKHRDQGGA